MAETVKKISPVFIPAAAIKDAPVDYWAEARQALGASLTIGKLTVPPPTLGVFALLEWIDSGFFRDCSTADATEIGRALAIASSGGCALRAVVDFCADRPGELDALALAAVSAAGDALTPEKYRELCNWLLVTPWTGFAMLPKRDSRPEPFLFGARCLAGAALLAGQKLGLTPDAVFWDTPLALLGHASAAAAEASGVEGVSRPKDPDDIRRKLAEARAVRDAAELEKKVKNG